MPAALVMSATRSILRASAQRLIEPGEVLRRVNEHLCPDMPEKMFVTCLYGVLDPRRAAALRERRPQPALRQDRRRRRSSCAPAACRSGLMPGMGYEEKEVALEPGDSVLLHSDGMVEAHDPEREMFGFPRLKEHGRRAPGRTGR